MRHMWCRRLKASMPCMGSTTDPPRRGFCGGAVGNRSACVKSVKFLLIPFNCNSKLRICSSNRVPTAMISLEICVALVSPLVAESFSVCSMRGAITAPSASPDITSDHVQAMHVINNCKLRYTPGKLLLLSHCLIIGVTGALLLSATGVSFKSPNKSCVRSEQHGFVFPPGIKSSSVCSLTGAITTASPPPTVTQEHMQPAHAINNCNFWYTPGKSLLFSPWFIIGAIDVALQSVSKLDDALLSDPDHQKQHTSIERAMK